MRKRMGGATSRVLGYGGSIASRVQEVYRNSESPRGWPPEWGRAIRRWQLLLSQAGMYTGMRESKRKETSLGTTPGRCSPSAVGT